jgi:hypothetical protein
MRNTLPTISKADTFIASLMQTAQTFEVVFEYPDHSLVWTLKSNSFAERVRIRQRQTMNLMLSRQFSTSCTLPVHGQPHSYQRTFRTQHRHLSYMLKGSSWDPVISNSTLQPDTTVDLDLDQPERSPCLDTVNLGLSCCTASLQDPVRGYENGSISLPNKPRMASKLLTRDLHRPSSRALPQGHIKPRLQSPITQLFNIQHNVQTRMLPRVLISTRQQVRVDLLNFQSKKERLQILGD